MNLQSYRCTPEGLKLRFKGFERNLSLGAPDERVTGFNFTVPYWAVTVLIQGLHPRDNKQ